MYIHTHINGISTYLCTAHPPISTLFAGGLCFFGISQSLHPWIIWWICPKLHRINIHQTWSVYTCTYYIYVYMYSYMYLYIYMYVCTVYVQIYIYMYTEYTYYVVVFSFLKNSRLFREITQSVWVGRKELRLLKRKHDSPVILRKNSKWKASTS